MILSVSLFSVVESCACRHQLELSRDNFHNPAMRLRRAAARVDCDDALRLSRRDGAKPSMHAGEESTVLLLEPIFVGMFIRTLVSAVVRALVPPPGTTKAHRGIRIKQDR
jgi:hypothetical protein